MFITCQECNTTFRLDESLLKPTGSKVRCSQCRHMFVAYPPAPQPAAPAHRAVMSPVVPVDESPPPAPQVPEEERELEGIDLAELDSLLDGEVLQDAGMEEDLKLDLEDAASDDEQLELDEADLELDFDAALDLDDEDAPAAVIAEEGGDEEIDLDMDFSLDEDLSAAPDETAEAVAEIDDALSLGADFEGAETAAGEDAARSEEGLDLDLDLDGLTSEAEEADAVAPVGQSKDDLDLADFDFALGDEQPEKELVGEEPELSLAEGSEFDLDESEADLETPVATAAEDNQAQGLDLDIDFGDELELDMEQDTETAAAHTQEPELELALEPGKPGEQPGDDLDLSDLDSLLESGEEDLGGPADDSDDLELELDLDDKPQPEAAVKAPVEEDLEDLEFELDTEFKDAPADLASPEGEIDETIGEEDEIDLSDIEQMLEGDEVQERTPKPAEAFGDLDLDLGDDGGEIDLTDIESAIDAAESVSAGKAADQQAEEPELELDFDLNDQPTKEEVSDDLELDLSLEDDTSTSDDLELDLDLELESDTASAKAQPVEVDDSELDLSDLSELIEEPKKKIETIDTGDIELEFEIEEDKEEPVSAAKDVVRTARREPIIPIEETLDAPFVEGKPEKAPRKPVKPKKKTSKTLVFLFILILLGGIGYGAYYAVTQLGIEIPYVSDYLKPKPQDPAGTLNLSTLEINSKFIENSVSGRLFVITGKVRNGYSANRGKIRLQGKLFTKGKVLAKTEYSYAGILLDDQELATLPIDQVKQRLTAVPQVQTNNTIVRPGQNLPFMVVFSELPPAEQLDEFAIELLSSVQAQ